MVLAKVLTASLWGLEAIPVQVEVDVANGLPSFDLVGLPNLSIRESRERVRSAVRNSGLEFPLKRITVNLTPADLRKEGPSFDLPIAIGILAATGQVPAEQTEDVVWVGELSLDGQVRGVNGVLAMAALVRELSRAENREYRLAVPGENAGEAELLLPGQVWPVRQLVEIVKILRKECAAGETGSEDSLLQPAGDGALELTALPGGPQAPDLSEVRGHRLAKRALEVAAAGGHHLMLLGPPGSGKTMLSRCLPSILPALSFDECLEVTRIYSIAGLLKKGQHLVAERPFRAPHHTCSAAALVGGGRAARPGEISLAHGGVLFLDEMLEFSREALEALRQPLEDGVITVSRAGASHAFPCRFLLVGSMNPWRFV